VGLIIRLPELSPTLTTRERFGQHSKDTACAGCHVMMDPIGLGFENYDAVGRFRATENNQPVDASGNVAGTDVEGDFVGPAALGAKLATSTDVKHCIATNAFRYANGRGETEADACAIAELDTKFAAAKYDFKELMIALTQTDSFLYRRGAP
jgi:hypothetical protein